MFWKHHEPEFDRKGFVEFLSGVILDATEVMMADIAKLQADVDAQAGLISAVKAKIDAQAAKIAELEAQIAANPGDPQAPVDALVATVDANNAALTTAAV